MPVLEGPTVHRRVWHGCYGRTRHGRKCGVKRNVGGDGKTRAKGGVLDGYKRRDLVGVRWGRCDDDFGDGEVVRGRWLMRRGGGGGRTRGSEVVSYFFEI